MGLLPRPCPPPRPIGHPLSMNGEGGIDGVISNAPFFRVSHSRRLGLGAEGAHL